MVKNILALVVLSVTLCACATTHNIKLTTTTVPVAVPLIYSPAPPVVARPSLPYQTMSPADQKVDGKVAQAYAASVEALLGYSEQLELIISQYKDINQAYAQLRTKLIEDWKTKTGTDITVPETPALSTLPSKPTTSAPTPVVPSVSDLAK